ncbi:MAG: alkaline phosphatase D family protein [Novosphingobium sp.]|uniref:alkaline phosphatase D family protein n=1 Tax=Novosphingobium sp. TaxID=1874826 RepID=UPI0032BC09DB
MPLPPPPAPVPHTSRRTAMKLAALGLAGAGAPALAQGSTGFTHGVASGEPRHNLVLLWTRYQSGQETVINWEVAEDEGFTRIVSQGDGIASPANDCCVKVWAKGLLQGRWYYYRFIGPAGERSPTGRTRTLPYGKTKRFRMAVFSCSNFGFGHFNAYAHAAQSGEFDLAVHLGDYFYEYRRSDYPSAKVVLPGRESPIDEAVTLEGYRDRFRTYRRDPDLQRLHQVLPMVAMWDDHELANDTWMGGAENHQANEGDWAARKAAAEKAYREWMPVGDADYTQYDIGNLATLFKVDSRHLARGKPLDLFDVFKQAAPGQAEAAYAAFRDGVWRAEDRTVLGGKQEAWLASALKASVKARKPWQVLGQQIVMGQQVMSEKVIAGMPTETADWLKVRLQANIVAGRAGVPWNMDSWGGYPAARARLYKASLEAGANLVVLSGDSHNAWAFDLDHKGRRVGVEMAGHSVTSPGAEGTLGWLKADELARDMIEANPQLKWCDTAQRGYMAVELTPASATSEWRFMASVRQKGTALAGVKRMTVLAGQRKFSL